MPTRSTIVILLSILLIGAATATVAATNVVNLDGDQLTPLQELNEGTDPLKSRY